ncbi:flagellar assembly protein FliH [Photobacterium damselae]|uniref:flagellar assembly protein FliH n=1 Tax=Photobacterium damselae TaxID=38293 RepID=UPI003C6DFFFF
MDNDRRRGFVRINSDQAEVLERWCFPDYSDELPHQHDNALNYELQRQVPEPEPHHAPEENSPPPLTAADLDEIHQSAYDDGFAEGRKAGYDEGFSQGQQDGQQLGQQQGVEQGLAQGLEQAQTHIATQVDALALVMDNLATPIAVMNEEVRAQVLQLAISLTRELIRVEVQTNSQVILQTINDVIASLPVVERETHIALNPEDHQQVLEAYGSENLAERKWILTIEPALQRGDVQVRAGDASVDYRMEQRIRHLLQQFVGNNNLDQESIAE